LRTAKTAQFRILSNGPLFDLIQNEKETVFAQHYYGPEGCLLVPCKYCFVVAACVCVRLNATVNSSRTPACVFLSLWLCVANSTSNYVRDRYENCLESDSCHVYSSQGNWLNYDRCVGNKGFSSYYTFADVFALAFFHLYTTIPTIRLKC